MKNCTTCQHANSERAKFCEECGASLANGLLPLNTLALENGTNGHNLAAIEGSAAASIVQGNITIHNTHHTLLTSTPLTLSLLEALPLYLNNLIDTNQYLRFHGIRAGGQPISVEVEGIYVPLRAVDKRVAYTNPTEALSSAELTVPEALARYKHLVIMGDPGSGKTTLLQYLALTYARAVQTAQPLVQMRLQLADEDLHLPILLPLRDFGRHLKLEHPDPGQDGPALLLDYLHSYFTNQNIHLPPDFFVHFLNAAQAIVLLDGLDEVAEAKLRGRVARILEKFALRFKGCRFVVTSRETGYTDIARLVADFGLARVRDFNQREVQSFLRDWTRIVECKLANHESREILHLADQQSDRLIKALAANDRIAALAVNPLLLTVIALVHRYRARLPERRADLYAEAVDVLLARWDEGKGIDDGLCVAGRLLDVGDRRALLEPIALWLHEKQRRELELEELQAILRPRFSELFAPLGMEARTPTLTAQSAVNKAISEFLECIEQRSGLLLPRGGGYGFAHLTFQEYLAARAVSDRADFVSYTCKRLSDPWWREVILLEASYLSDVSRRRASELIRAIINAPSSPRTEPEPHHQLRLAAECCYDAGVMRLEGDLLNEIKQRLHEEADQPWRRSDKVGALRKIYALNILSQVEREQFGQAWAQFWAVPWGEPEWVSVPAGVFRMGSVRYNESPLHRVFVPAFRIAQVPITNAQYALFVKDADHRPPADWSGGQPAKDKGHHPVVNVTWQDAVAYCRWLSQKIGRPVRLPTEAEWEKAARGSSLSTKPLSAQEQEYPWGDEWQELYSNTIELGLYETTPVGLFPQGASPYGCLDMAGNVWEWCQSKYQPYPYQAEDGRELMDANGDLRVLRGGSFFGYTRARCANRFGFDPGNCHDGIGFRVCIGAGV